MQDEEDAFWCLVHLLHVQDWRAVFTNHQSKLRQVLDTLSAEIDANWPELGNRLRSHLYLTVEAAFSTQMITLFVATANQEVALRIFDNFLVNGPFTLIWIILGMINA